MNKLKIAWDYFLYHPDKTEVVLQIYVLNPIYDFISKVIFKVLDILRFIIKQVIK